MPNKFKKKVSKRLIGNWALGAVVVLSMGCAPTSQSSDVSVTKNPNNQNIASPESGSQSDAYVTGQFPVPLSWESSAHPERAAWSAYLEQIIVSDWSTLLAGADDMATFCPRYSSLSNDQRANFWAMLFSAMSNYESAYNPLSRMKETTLGVDPVTGQSVYSEGLLQLSYGDMQSYPFCQFDWSKDKSLSPADPQKTILQPDINLYCGVGIMAKQIQRKGLITVGVDAYWEVLKSNSANNKIKDIAAITQTLPFCK